MVYLVNSTQLLRISSSAVQKTIFTVTMFTCKPELERVDDEVAVSGTVAFVESVLLYDMPMSFLTDAINQRI